MDNVWNDFYGFHSSSVISEQKYFLTAAVAHRKLFILSWVVQNCEENIKKSKESQELSWRIKMADWWQDGDEPKPQVQSSSTSKKAILLNFKICSFNRFLIYNYCRQHQRMEIYFPFLFSVDSLEQAKQHYSNIFWKLNMLMETSNVLLLSMIWPNWTLIKI